MVLEISSTLVARLLAEANTSPDHEICGLLFGHADRVTAAEACANIAANLGDSFEIDPAALFAAHRAERAGGPALMGYFHSHPNGSPIASTRDHAASCGDGMIWLILASGHVRAWRATSQERLTPVDLVISEPSADPDRAAE